MDSDFLRVAKGGHGTVRASNLASKGLPKKSCVPPLEEAWLLVVAHGGAFAGFRSVGMSCRINGSSSCARIHVRPVLFGLRRW
jgi:hypothetical protein